MAKNIRKNSKKTATSGSADGRLDVKALARAVGLSFDGLALSPTGRSALNTAPDQAAGQSEQHDRLAGGKPQITNGPDVARSAGVETGNNAGDNAVGRGNIADRVADTKPTGFETGHSTPGAAGSAASQSLINGLAVAENVSARPSDGGRAAGATDINAIEFGAPGQAGSGTSGSDFVRFAVGTGTAAAPAASNGTATTTDTTINLSASTQTEGSSASYVFTATLSDASQGVTTIHTDQGDITIADGATTGTLTIAAGNGEDVYQDASSLTATITGVSGGNFEHLVVGSGTATANVTDTITDATVSLSASTQTEGSSASYVFTATLSDASQGVTTIHTDQGDITIADGATTGTLTIAAGNGEDVYQDASSLTATITGVSGGNFEHLVVGSGTATANVTDTITDATVSLSASTQTEGSSASYVFTATLSDASQGVTTIHTDQGDITIADGATTGTLTIAAGNGEDVYQDASSLTATITGVSGGNFEHLVVGSGTATANVTDTITDATVSLSASTQTEGSSASYVFTATLSDASQGVTTIHTDQGDITIADGATTGTLTIAAGNGEDVYQDASSLTATITGVSGGNFEHLVVGSGTATANVTDTITDATVSLSASTQTEGSSASYVFTATLSDASQGVTTIHTDQGDITIADGATTGTLTIAAGNGEDVYQDASSLTATITGVSGGNFEHLVVGSGTATANVTDTITDATVSLSASTQTEGSSASYVFTATLSDASQGVTTIHTDQGDITIADGATTGTLTIAAGNGEDVYQDASSLTATITGVSGRQLRAPGGRLRHGDGQRHRHHHRRDGEPIRLDPDRGLERQLRVHGDAVGCLARRDDDPHRPGRHHDRRWRHDWHAHDRGRQRRGRVPGCLQPDGDDHRRVWGQLRAPGGRLRHGDGQRHRHHHRRDGEPICLDPDRGLERQLRVHGDAVGCLARRDDDPHRPGRHHDRRWRRRLARSRSRPATARTCTRMPPA